jgi:transposase
MEIPVTTPKGLLADKGYDGGRFRESLLIRGILPIIPPRSNRKVPEHPDYRRYRDRNRVERMFGKLKQQRRIATRYDKTILSFESFLNLAATRLWLKSLSTRPGRSHAIADLAIGAQQHGFLAQTGGDQWRVLPARRASQRIGGVSQSSSASGSP